METKNLKNILVKKGWDELIIRKTDVSLDTMYYDGYNGVIIKAKYIIDGEKLKPLSEEIIETDNPNFNSYSEKLKEGGIL
ncbi:MAG: hypothetical protein KKF48_04580 [Nanoarchaeota archaeon]|nr:hypothetical protein [Nanoarchaeota archaeon]MBU1028292.1 hypothetical protein [Nanoarchaeota archaeon]